MRSEIDIPASLTLQYGGIVNYIQWAIYISHFKKILTEFRVHFCYVHILVCLFFMMEIWNVLETVRILFTVFIYMEHISLFSLYLGLEAHNRIGYDIGKVKS